MTITKIPMLAASGLAFVSFASAMAHAQTDQVSPPPASNGEAPAPFTLIAVAIDGATVFRGEQLSGAYEPYLLNAVGEEDLVRIADAVTRRYHDAGFFLSRAVVGQYDTSGLAHIAVIEGRITEIAYDGDGADIVRRYMRGFDTQGPARLEDLDRRLARASDVPGLRVQTRIEPDLQDPARHRLIITANIDRFEGMSAFDNRGANSEGPVRGYSEFNFNSAIRQADQTRLALYGAVFEPEEFAGGELSYRSTLDDGAQWRAALSASRSYDGPDVVSPDAGGDRQQASLQFTYPLLRTRNRGLWANAEIDAAHIAYDWTGGGGYIDETRVLRAGLRGFLNEQGHSTNVFIETSFGLDILGASQTSPRRSRANADARFVSVDLHLAHYRDLGRLFGLYAAIDGQWSDGPLLFSEQFVLGGPLYGRGFPYGTLFGDRGVAGLLELRAGADPQWRSVSFIQAYAFADAGWTAEASGDNEASLSSIGTGLRVTFDDRVRAGFELAHPIHLTGEDDLPDWRSYFSLSAQY